VGFAGNIVLVAMRDISASEELTTDYALFDDSDGTILAEDRAQIRPIWRSGLRCIRPLMPMRGRDSRSPSSP
jgi:hypothetical protein